jgi:hypothetical protein
MAQHYMTLIIYQSIGHIAPVVNTPLCEMNERDLTGTSDRGMSRGTLRDRVMTGHLPSVDVKYFSGHKSR